MRIRFKQTIGYLFVSIFLSCLMTTVSAKTRPIIIDTDVGLDDLVAITYLLEQPSIEVKAITIAATGETPCVPAYLNLKRMLQQLGKAEIPVYCGRATPLRGTHHFPPEWTPFPNETSTEQPPINAVAAIRKLLTDTKQTYDIVAIGPLTNIGEVLHTSPTLANKIHMLYIMGGAIHVPGNLQLGDKNLNDKAEWNIYIDPYAANLVFHSQTPITLIPLDLTNLIKLPPQFYTELQHSRNKAAQYLYQTFQSLPEAVTTSMTATDWYAWDTLAAVIASHPAIVQTTVEKIRVVTEPDLDSGALVIDAVKGKRMHVCYSINPQKFMSYLNTTFSTKPPVKTNEIMALK